MCVGGWRDVCACTQACWRFEAGRHASDVLTTGPLVDNNLVGLGAITLRKVRRSGQVLADGKGRNSGSPEPDAPPGWAWGQGQVPGIVFPGTLTTYSLRPRESWLLRYLGPESCGCKETACLICCWATYSFMLFYLSWCTLPFEESAILSPLNWDYIFKVN
jgi:hypothetical protein